MQLLQENLVIAGMGITGQSLSRYFENYGIGFAVCDDKSEAYTTCKDCQRSHREYVFKSPGMPDQSLGQIKNHDRIVNDIELFMRVCLKPVILVTGTNGKSTVVALVSHILNACDVYAIACGNNGIPVFDAYSMQPDIYVIELSSYQLENIKTLVSYSSVVLNVGIDHIDRYDGIDSYRAVKERIYTNSSKAIYPVGENDKTSFGVDIGGYVYATEDSRDKFHVEDGDICRNGEKYCAIDGMRLVGKHNYLNACAALSLCYEFCQSDADVIKALSTFNGLPHRLETVCIDNRNRIWVNDSKSTNVHAAWAALTSFDTDIYLIMGGRGKGEDFTDFFDAFKGTIKSLILYGESADDIYSQADCIANKNIVSDVSQAVIHANRIGQDSSVVLFSPACASFDQYVDFVSRGDDFKHCVLAETK